jgi:hypothetical protein
VIISGIFLEERSVSAGMENDRHEFDYNYSALSFQFQSVKKPKKFDKSYFNKDDLSKYKQPNKVNI